MEVNFCMLSATKNCHKTWAISDIPTRGKSSLNAFQLSNSNITSNCQLELFTAENYFVRFDSNRENKNNELRMKEVNNMFSFSLRNCLKYSSTTFQCLLFRAVTNRSFESHKSRGETLQKFQLYNEGERENRESLILILLSAVRT